MSDEPSKDNGSLLTLESGGKTETRPISDRLITVVKKILPRESAKKRTARLAAEQVAIDEARRSLKLAEADAEVAASREDLPGEKLTDLPEQEIRSLISEDPHRLAKLLSNTRLYRTDESGAYINLYSPQAETQGNPPLAVKVIRTEGRMFNYEESPLEARTDNGELQAVLDPPSNIIFVGRENLRVEDLSPTDRKFVLMAMEHMKHEEFFGELVKPAVFIAYPAPYADVSEPRDDYASDPDSRWTREMTKPMVEEGKFTSDFREIYFKRGETLYTMVQEFVDMGPNVFTLDPASFSPSQKAQLRSFAETVQSVWENYGYCPDPYMWKPISGNL